MPMVASPTGAYLYVARRSEPFAVITLAVDKEAAQLSVAAQTPLPASMAYISLDQTGRVLLAASYQGNLVSASPIGDDGVALQATQTIGTGPHAHALVASPCNRFALATVLGSDQVLQFHLDQDTHALRPNVRPYWRAKTGSGPRHLRFHPHLPLVYLLNELDASIDVLASDLQTGQLSHLQSITTLPATLPASGASGSATGQAWAADLHITPDARFLYSSERNTSTLAHCSIDHATGLLSLVGHTQTETQPRGFAICGAGHNGLNLIACGQQTHHISRYAIDEATGVLRLAQRLPAGQNPNWVTVIP